MSAVRPGRKKIDHRDHPLSGIEKDGILTVFKNRSVPSQVEELIRQFNYCESMGMVDEGKKILDQIASIPDVPDILADYWKSRGARSRNGFISCLLSAQSPVRRNNFEQQRGSKGITGYGRKMIASACTVLEILNNRGSNAFLTLTTPTLSNDDLEALNAQWSTVQRRFIDELKRELARHGLPDRIICVTEIQEKRFRLSGQVCLHLHLLFCGRQSGKYWAISTDWFREVWRRILSNHGIESDCRAATRVEKLRKSASKEMAKYMSKGGKCLGDVKAAGKSHQLPCQWWYISPELKAEVKRRIKRVQGEQAGRVLEHRYMLQELGLCRFREVWMELESVASDLSGGSQPGEQPRRVLMGIAGYFLNGVDAKALLDAQNEAEFFAAVEGNLERLSTPQGTLVSVCS